MKRLTTIPTTDQLKNVRRAARDLGCIVYTDTYYHIKGGHIALLLNKINADKLLPIGSFETYVTTEQQGRRKFPALRIRRK